MHPTVHPTLPPVVQDLYSCPWKLVLKWKPFYSQYFCMRAENYPVNLSAFSAGTTRSKCQIEGTNTEVVMPDQFALTVGEVCHKQQDTN